MVLNRMMKKKKFSKKIYFFFIATAVIGLIFIFVSSFSLNSSYTIKRLGLKLSAPKRYIVSENGETIILEDGSDQIRIIRYSTSTQDINEFIQSFERQKNIDVTITDEKSINNGKLYEINIHYLLNSKPTEKAYLFLDDEWVYDISASSLLLYKDMYTVANSIIYIKPDGDLTYQYITPTTLPVKNTGWKRFEHPLNHFSFEFPSDWKLQLYKRRSGKDWYEVSLTGIENGDQFKINFMTGGRGSPNYDYETNTVKMLGDILTNWHTMYKDGKAFEISVGFPNNDFYDKLVGLYIYLPVENQDQFIQKVEKLISTLEK